MTESPFEKLARVSRAYQESCVLTAAAELDVFTVILGHGNALTASGIAGKTGADPRGLAVLLDTLAALEYLVKDGADANALYGVAEAYRELLDSRHPGTFVPMLRHMACVQRSWVQLARTVKEGKKQERPASILGHEQDRMSFIMAMNSIARNLVDETMASLLQAKVLSFPREDIRFLDIGGASGTYTLAFLQTLPRSRGAIFDLPVGVEAAKKRFLGSEYESRVELFSGDFYAEELPSGFDFAWVSAIIHQMNREESRKLYGKAFRALNPGGRIAIRDFMMNAARTAPVSGALFGINMLVGTDNGMVYTYDEVKADLEAAGFKDVAFAVPADTMSAVVVAVRPA